MAIKNIQQLERKNHNIKSVCEFILGSGNNGVSIKDICEKFGLSSTTVSRYTRELIDKGLISFYQPERAGQGMSPYYYIWKTESQETTEAPKEEEKPVEKPNYGGKKFDVVKPAKNIGQGDIIYISSRSGGGEFFRYLIITPWERKATVVGVVPKGHPTLNLNNPWVVNVGVDPESGEELYADLSNFCSRGYKEFGEKLMHIEKEKLDNVKLFMARYHGIEMADKASSEACERLHKKYTEAKAEIASLNKRANDLSALIGARATQIDSLTELLSERNHQLDILQADLDRTAEQAKQYELEVENLSGKLAEAETTILTLNEELEKPQEVPFAEVDADYIKTLENTIGDISLENERLTTTVACYREYIDTLKMAMFKAIGGKNGN